MIHNFRILCLSTNRNQININNWRRLHLISTSKNTNLSSYDKVLNGNAFTKCSFMYAPKPNNYSLMPVQKYLSTTNVMMEKSEIKLSKKDQLKKAIKEYGSTVIVFHVTISLASLGFFYVLVSSGIDMQQVMNYFGVNYKFVENAGTFVTAYAIHKLFAPVRISITLGATPFIVRYLRNKGILRKV
ncbi:protein FAM210B, mitochondrial-like [Harmonia axyridis]|uniref:protein FAM210B, mitochondrial-like n=1 Tax=Harmonia axyridis TaxID=115357 RepID=UPI001E276FBF|nr:protein FAM210B, mitochondrial-like [Harmonia axyridis]